MANDTSKDPVTKAQPQTIPLSKIHELPGVFITKMPDKSYGGLVGSILAGGVKEPVVLRQREDGEYQLVSGYRRLKASELAKKADIPALIYEMSMEDARAYFKTVKEKPDAPVPGKLIDPAAKKDKEPEKTAGEKKSAVSEDKSSGQMKLGEMDKPEQSAPDKEGKASDKPIGPGDKDKAQTAAAKPEQPAPAKDEKAKEGGKQDGPGNKDKAVQSDAAKKAEPVDKPAEPGEKNLAQTVTDKPEQPAPGKDEKARPVDKPAAPGDKDKTQPVANEEKSEEQTNPSKKREQPTVAEIVKKAESGQVVNLSDLIDAQQREREAKKNAAPAVSEAKAKEQPADKAKTASPAPAETKEPPKPASLGPAATGPTGTIITQTLEDRLNPPDEAAIKGIPAPQEGESIFVRLHPEYLVRSEYNTFSVDTKSENFNELLTSIKNVGVKDPVLARFNAEGKLEVLSGQRRHLAATLLNYPVPTIIQKIDDADAKILVADGNLHRDKITTYDLSRALRMKMEGMKQKAGRRKKGFSADELNSDQKLAKEMGMSPQKINRIIRLSEAIKDVCDRVDDGSLTVSVASNISFLKPKNQEMVLHLSDLGYKVKSEHIDRMKKAQAGGKLDEAMMRDILDDKDIAPKVQPAPTPSPVPAPAATPAPAQAAPETAPIQAAPSVSPAPSTVSPAAAKPEQATAPTTIPASPDVSPAPVKENETPVEAPAVTPAPASPSEKPDEPFKGQQERPEVTKVILTGDRLRKYFPDVSMTPREIEESVYEALEERRQRQEKLKQKEAIFKKGTQPKR